MMMVLLMIQVMVTVIIMTMMIITAITGEDKDDNGYIGNGKNKD